MKQHQKISKYLNLSKEFSWQEYWAETEEKLKRLLMSVKDENEKVGLKLKIKKN